MNSWPRLPKIKSAACSRSEWKSQASALCQHALPEADVCPLQKNFKTTRSSPLCHRRSMRSSLVDIRPRCLWLPPGISPKRGEQTARARKRHANPRECLKVGEDIYSRLPSVIDARAGRPGLRRCGLIYLFAGTAVFGMPN